jgi:hemoglobin
MEFQIREYLNGQRPEVTLPSYDMYRILGEEGIRTLVSDLYDLLKTSAVRHLFPQEEEEFEQAKKNAADFFVQVCGGPMYFNKNRGRPMMYKRHLPHKITPQAREVWLDCYRRALQNQSLPDETALSFWNYLNIFSMWMVNSQP